MSSSLIRSNPSNLHALFKSFASDFNEKKTIFSYRFNNYSGKGLDKDSVRKSLKVKMVRLTDVLSVHGKSCDSTATAFKLYAV